VIERTEARKATFWAFEVVMATSFEILQRQSESGGAIGFTCWFAAAVDATIVTKST
jgi:hypothetical protein